ncbi:MAG: hypothetical protein DHS20C21_13120 [Gemmatimonadota bacterium]|nr:MAG: hypothetical protein DHS20C21_13120 [Gemmatimonadota bacterium]
MSEIFGAGFDGLSEQGRLRKTAQELESVVLTQLMAAMRNTVPEGGLFEKSAADDIFRSMLDGELARVTAEKSPFGLAEAIVDRFEKSVKGTESLTESMNRSQESTSPPPPADSAADGQPRSWRI